MKKNSIHERSYGVVEESLERNLETAFKIQEIIVEVDMTLSAVPEDFFQLATRCSSREHMEQTTF